MDIKRTGAWN